MTQKNAVSTAPAESSIMSDSHFSLAHLIEQDVRRKLLEHENCEFHSLVVHRMQDGICLQGVLECDDQEVIDEIMQIAREVAGVSRVVNQIVVRKKTCGKPPLKG
jgi:osmotically-inducible protein OsmY